MALLDDWIAWMQENYFWFLPFMGALSGPIVASGLNIGYDYITTSVKKRRRKK